MALLGTELTPMARANELYGISYGRWLEETLSEGIPYKGFWSGMVAVSL